MTPSRDIMVKTAMCLILVIGQDIINDIGGSDKLVFGEGITKANITITRSSNGHILVYILDAQGNRTGDQLTLENAFSNTQYRIERIEFADGSSMGLGCHLYRSLGGGRHGKQ